MLIIRLKPLGKKHNRVYRIVIALKHIHVSKKSIEDLGFYNPKTKEFKINKERFDYFHKLNVELSDTVKALCKKNLVLS